QGTLQVLAAITAALRDQIEGSACESDVFRGSETQEVLRVGKILDAPSQHLESDHVASGRHGQPQPRQDIELLRSLYDLVLDAGRMEEEVYDHRQIVGCRRLEPDRGESLGRRLLDDRTLFDVTEPALGELADEALCLPIARHGDGQVHVEGLAGLGTNGERESTHNGP